MREKPRRYEAAKELAGIPLQFDGKQFGYYLDRRPKDFVPPTDEEIDAKHEEMVKEWESLEYQRLRKPEYPSIEECVHALLDDKLEELQAKRLAVKEKYPKPVVEEPKPELKDGN
jgi:hypothetical protein